MDEPKPPTEPAEVGVLKVVANTVVDREGGKVVTTSESANSTVVRRVHNAIAEMLDQGPATLIAELDAAVSRDDIQVAAQTLLAAHRRGGTGLGKSLALCAVISKVPLSRLETHTALEFARARFELQHRARRFLAASEDAVFLLDNGAAQSDDHRRSLEMVVALGDYERGERESALLRFRRFADDKELDVLDRAWAWRNISIYLPLGDEQCELAARHSSDLFLASGKKADAASSLVRAVRSRLITNPPTAAALLDEVLSWIGEDDAIDQLHRGGMLQNRARANFMVGRPREALDDALRSSTLLRGLVGAERELLTSLSIAVDAMQKLDEDASSLSRELDELSARVDQEGHAARRGILKLLDVFDEAEFQELRQRPVIQRDASLRALLFMAEAVTRPNMSDADRVAGLEVARGSALQSDNEGTLVTVLGALGQVLASSKQEDRALGVYREIHAIEPTNRAAIQAIASLLHRLGKHRDAVRFFEDEVQRWGPQPGLRFGLGRALLGLGETDRAANVLAAVAMDANASESARSIAAEWRDKALAAGGRLVSHVPKLATVLRAEVEGAFAEFGDYIRREKRMEFWRREPGAVRKHNWVPQPERLARNIFHAFLAARFSERLDAFEEVDAGAGRIDLYLRFEGGLAVVVELKMLGGGTYSTDYAWSGRSQLVHYMDNRRSSLGYLVVFDARVRSWGEAPPGDDASASRHTISVAFVDVRPTVTPP